MTAKVAGWALSAAIFLSHVTGAEQAAGSDARGTLILDERASWRQYYRFGADLVSPAALRAEGEKTLGKPAFERLRAATARDMTRSGRDNFGVVRASAIALEAARRCGTTEALRQPRGSPAAADWMEHVFLRMFFDPYTAPPPPDDWMAGPFDDSSWVLRRSPFQVDLLHDLPPSRTTGNMAKVHIDSLQYIGGGMQACFYRTRFAVNVPADLVLRVAYRGGVRAFINGEEVARGHLPKGKLAANAAAEGYPVEAYRDPTLRDRTLGPATVPQRVLRRGINVLAVEVRSSLLHPIVLAKDYSKSWNALHDKEGLWRHGHLSKLELRSASPGAASAPTRLPGTQVWVQDPHHRVESTEFLPPGEPVGVIRVVGARNGTYSAQVVVGTDHELASLEATPSDLKRAGGAEPLPASVVRVAPMAPFPADEFSHKLGDERGLGASFPSPAALSQHERMEDPRRGYVFDHITSGAPGRVPAGTCRPLWLSFRIPAEAAPGLYRGSLEVKAQGMSPIRVPVEAEVVAWRLPPPKQFQTFVACEQNPYGVAKHYGVPLWSDEHFRLLEASFRQLARVGNTWLNVPILCRTELGNQEDSPVRWTRRRDGTLAFDYTRLDRYLDLAVRHWGAPRVINFLVMHGSTAGLQPPSPPEVSVFDEAAGKAVALPVGGPGISAADKRRLWQRFATALHEHLKARGLEKSMHWGHPHDREEDPELRALLAECTPGVGWTASPHQIGSWGFKEPQAYKVFGTVRYFGNWPTFRLDMGWKSPVTHLAFPRVDSSILSLHTASHPFPYRVLVDHALALGRSGISRIGSDEWAAVHYEGMRVPTWIVGMPVLFTLWPGRDGAEPSARFEALVEGVQEAEARIFLEQAIERGGLPQPLARQAQDALSQHLQETSFFQNKLCVHELETYHYRWQERSRRLYEMAAAVSKETGR